MDKTELLFTFCMFGDKLDAELITSTLSLTPTKTAKKGESIPGRAIVYKNSFWEYSLGWNESLYLEELIAAFFAVFEGKASIIKGLADKMDLDIKIFIAVRTNNEQAPAVYFNKSFIKFLATLDAEIDMDLYYNNQPI